MRPGGPAQKSSKPGLGEAGGEPDLSPQKQRATDVVSATFLHPPPPVRTHMHTHTHFPPPPPLFPERTCARRVRRQASACVCACTFVSVCVCSRCVLQSMHRSDSAISPYKTRGLKLRADIKRLTTFSTLKVYRHNNKKTKLQESVVTFC